MFLRLGGSCLVVPFVGGCPTMTPDLPPEVTPPLAPGIYQGDVTLAVTGSLTAPDDTPVGDDQMRTESFVLVIGQQGLPESADGPIKVGDQFASVVGTLRVMLIITDVMSEGGAVVTSYTVTALPEQDAGVPPLPPFLSLGSGSDSYLSSGENEISFLRKWSLSTTVEDVVNELTVNGAGTFTKQ